MTINILKFLEALSQKYPAEFGAEVVRLIIASSSDPFEEFDCKTAAKFKEFCQVFKLDLDDRYAIQFPWKAGDGRGFLSITSQPDNLLSPLEKLLDHDQEFAEGFSQSNCVITADSIGPVMNRINGKAAYIINPSSAMRPQVAIATANRPAILPMNHKEAQSVLQIMLSHAQNEELYKVHPPPFPSPIEPSGLGIDLESLGVLNQSLRLFRRYDPSFEKFFSIAFSCVITFGDEGGLVHGIGANDINSFYCFTSIPNEQGRKKITAYLKEDLLFKQEHDVGCGDSVAAVITLFNTIDPTPILEEFMVGEEKNHNLLPDLAATIFVSTLSRIVGYLVLRTTNTHIDNISSDMLAKLVCDVANSCVEVTRRAVKKINSSPIFDIVAPFGIKCVTWRPELIRSQKENTTEVNTIYTEKIQI